MPVVLCDIKLGDMTGIDVLKEAKSINPHLPVVMISAEVQRLLLKR